MDLGLQGHRVMISAGAAGIGLGVARAFVREGARVAVCDVDTVALESLARSDPALHASACDVSQRGQVANWFDTALVHKISMALAAAGMLSQMIIGPISANFLHGTLDQRSAANAHLALGWATFAFMATGVIVNFF